MLTFSGNCRYIVLLAIQDEAYRFGRYYKYVLKRLNINPRSIRLGFRSSLAAIGYVGGKPYWVKQMSRLQRRGPSYVSARIPLGRGEGITRLVLYFSLTIFYGPRYFDIYICSCYFFPFFSIVGCSQTAESSKVLTL